MTSWISNGIPKKKVAPSPVSLIPVWQGKFVEKTKPPTLVTALYDDVSDKTLAILSEFQCPLIVFTEAGLAERIADARISYQDKTQVVVLERKDWMSVVRMLPNLWNQQVKQDPEIRLSRTAEDLQFLFEKKEFMVKAVTMNTFNTEDFVWLNPSSIASLKSPNQLFLNPEGIPTDRLLVYNPEHFTADDIASSNFRGKRRVDNAIIAGSKQAWLDYVKVYNLVSSLKLRISAFIGDDLLMLHYCVIHKPEQFCLVNQSLVEYLSGPL